MADKAVSGAAAAVDITDEEIDALLAEVTEVVEASSPACPAKNSDNLLTAIGLADHEKTGPKLVEIKQAPDNETVTNFAVSKDSKVGQKGEKTTLTARGSEDTSAGLVTVQGSGDLALSDQNTAIQIETNKNGSEADVSKKQESRTKSAPVKVQSKPGSVVAVSSGTTATSKTLSPGATKQMPELSSVDQMLAAADVILSTKKIQDDDVAKPNRKQKSLQAVGEKHEFVTGHCEQSGADLSPKSSTPPASQSKGWGWNSWSSSFISSASAITSKVGGSMIQVLEAVESSLVEPDLVMTPEDKESRRRSDKTRSSKMKQSDSVGDVQEEHSENVTQQTFDSKRSRPEIPKQSNIHEKPNICERNENEAGVEDSSTIDAHKWFTGWDLAGLTGAVQKSSKKVVGTGLQVLETISRKTINILTLGEDYEDDDDDDDQNGRQWMKARSKRKMSLLMKRFDNCLGTVHFDALKSIAATSSDKLTTQLDMLPADSLEAIKSDLALVAAAFDLGDIGWEMQLGDVDHDFPRLFNDYLTQLALNVNGEKITTIHSSIMNWMTSCRREEQDFGYCSPDDVHQTAILMYAEFTAYIVALFHKIAQLALTDTFTPVLSYKFRALCLAGLTKVLCAEIWIENRTFTGFIKKAGEAGDVVVLTLERSLTIEASNCSTCIQDSFGLLLPILQLALTRVHPLCIDNFGIPHLEGLQMISKMSETTVSNSMPHLDESSTADVHGIEALFELGHLLTPSATRDVDEKQAAEQDFSRLIKEAVKLIDPANSTEHIIATQAGIRNWLIENDQNKSEEFKTSLNDIHRRAVQSLCEFKSSVIEFYNRIAQVLLSDEVQATDSVSIYRAKAEALTSVTRVFCSEVGILSTKFTSCINNASQLQSRMADSSGPPSPDNKSDITAVTPFVTNIYLEASNCMTCIQDGYQLLMPVVQLAIVKVLKLKQSSQEESAAALKPTDLQ